MRGNQDGSGRSSGGARRVAVALLAGCLLPVLAAGDEPGAPPAEGSPATSRPAPTVSLDKLFELPSDYKPVEAERRGGVGEAEWRRRFFEARERIERSEAALQQSKAELAELAQSSDGWSVAPPVGTAPATNANDAPLSYELRQRMKRQQAEVQESKRQLLDLEVEANLAGVPDAWRQPE